MKKAIRGRGQKAVYWSLFLFLFFLVFSKLNCSSKFELTTFFFSHSNVSDLLGYYFILWRKNGNKNYLSLSAQLEQLMTAQKHGIFNSFFLFTLLLSISVCLLGCFLLGCCFWLSYSSKSRIIIAEIVAGKNIHMRKAWFP